MEIKTQTELSPEVLATLVEIGEEINASLDLDQVLEKAAALVKRLVDYEIFCVMLLDREAQSLSYRFVTGHRSDVLDEFRIPVGQGITGIRAISQSLKKSSQRLRICIRRSW